MGLLSELTWLKVAFMLLDLSFEKIMLNSPHYIFWKDKNSVYLGCNQQFAELAELNSPEEIIGKTDYDLWGTDGKEAQIFRQGDIDTINGNPVTNAKEYINKSNKKLWALLANKRTLINKKHHVVGIFGISVEINFADNNANTLGLSKRQSECLHYLIHGMTIKQIAKILGLSPRTVESYLENLKVKFNCHTKFDLISKVLEMGFRTNLIL